MSAVAPSRIPGVLPTGIVAIGGRRQVDVIDPDAVVADYFQPRQPIEHRAIDDRVAIRIKRRDIVPPLTSRRPRQDFDHARQECFDDRIEGRIGNDARQHGWHCYPQKG